ncbi:Uroporphyrinogen-III C-methyltransferase [bacterium HR19]|nr:Uroporphyrinogen-III C-methyltransferase [bacterium HR19]
MNLKTLFNKPEKNLDASAEIKFIIMREGKVFILGGGPGDPSLITQKAIEVLKKADVVIYDHLTSKELLLYAEKAEKIYVGKEAGKHTLSQEEINELMVRKAKEGKIVVRLKGGDPFIFGRGGEECEFLYENGIDFEVVPGISSFYSVPAYAGIPLTHRDFNSSFAVATGGSAEGLSKLDFSALSKCGTIVFLMTVKPLDTIVSNLLKFLPEDTPCAIIENGTTPLQRTIKSDLKNIVKESRENKISPPAIFIVGEVVKLREKLKWYEKKKLFGKKVVITRPANQSLEFSELLYNRGALPILFPAIKISFQERHKKNIENFIRYMEKDGYGNSIVVFTSQNGVKNFFSYLNQMKKDSRIFAGKKIAVVGEKTAEEIKKFGIIADIIPQNFTTSELLKILKETREENIFFLRAEGVKNIEDELVKSGKNVFNIEIYSIEKEEHSEEEVKEIYNISPDILTFTSSLSFLYFKEHFDSEWITKRTIACIGEVTAKTVEKHIGRKPEIISQKQTIENLVEEIERYFSEAKL